MTPQVWKSSVLSALALDTALYELLGVTPADPRIYWYYNGDAVLSETQPAYITYMLINLPEIPGAVVSPILSLMIWGIDEQVVENVRDRVAALFGDEQGKELVFSNQTVWSKKTNESDSYQETPHAAGRTMQYRFSWTRL